MYNVFRATAAPRRTLIRGFTASAPCAQDLAKLTLIGRLGRDPLVKTNVNNKEYIVYTVATSNPPGPPNEDGIRPDAGVSWHTILSFSPSTNNFLKTLQKGSKVYVETNYELKEADPNADPDSSSSKRQIFLRHENIRVLSRPPSTSEPKEKD